MLCLKEVHVCFPTTEPDTWEVWTEWMSDLKAQSFIDISNLMFQKAQLLRKLAIFTCNLCDSEFESWGKFESWAKLRCAQRYMSTSVNIKLLPVQALSYNITIINIFLELEIRMTR